MKPIIATALFASLTALLPAADPLEWALGLGGNGNSLYQEANWIDPITGLAPPAGAVDPNVDLDISLRIRTGGPGGGAGAGGTLRMGSGDLLVSRATLRMSRGQASGINMGATNPTLTIVDGKVLTQNVVDGNVVMQGHSDLTLYGPNPLTNTTIDLQSPDCFVFFLDRLPSNIDGGYLANFTVNGAPAVLNTNVTIRQYYNGAVIRPTLPGGVALKAFDLPDLQGTQWNFNTGFQGIGGLGLSEHDAGQYTIFGWGTDIWGTADQCHYAYRPLTGDGEIVAKVDSVLNTHFWAKAGVMIREDLGPGSRNAFVFQRPDGEVSFQSRSATDGGSANHGTTTGAAAANWVRLVRTGNDFAAFYSTVSAAGPWTSVGTTQTIAMAATVQVGLAVTSHIGVERCTSEFSEVTVLEGVVPAPASTLGIFDASADIFTPWVRDNQISSFLLKRGYMATFAEHSGGQGFSKVYAATEADLRINLPAELDDEVSFLRVVPWRWIAKKGWAGDANVFPNAIQTHWKYEWEPTGASVLNWEFVPMIKGVGLTGLGQNQEFRWEEVRVRGNQTHFLGFNEPNVPTQGNLSVDEAIALWPKAQQLGLRLGSPACTDNAAGDAWLADFMSKANARGYRVDYICLHNYAQTTALGLQAWLDERHDLYGLPIWLTEFQRDTDGDNPTAADHQAYLEEVLPMLEDLDYLERYAYYNFNTETPSNDFASLFNPDDTVNAKGVFYRDLVSNPAYANTGQPAWATVNLGLPGGSNVVAQGDGTTTAVTVSLDPALVSNVEFFANGVSLGTDSASPYEVSLDLLGPGLHTIYAVMTTTFGEQAVSVSRQVIVTQFELLDPSPGPAGEITWAAVPGESYRLETSQTLENASWSLVEPRVATGFVEVATDPAYGADTPRFYRIVWE